MIMSISYSFIFFEKKFISIQNITPTSTNRHLIHNISPPITDLSTQSLHKKSTITQEACPNHDFYHTNPFNSNLIHKMNPIISLTFHLSPKIQNNPPTYVHIPLTYLQNRCSYTLFISILSPYSSFTSHFKEIITPYLTGILEGIKACQKKC